MWVVSHAERNVFFNSLRCFVDFSSLVISSDDQLDWLQGARKVKAQGMGIHTAEEVLQFGCDDLKVLCDMLADKPFFFGDEPTTVRIALLIILNVIFFF